MRHYCTYFDHRYLDRGLVLLRSLHQYGGPFTLHALCLTEAAYDALTKLKLAGLRPWHLASLETAYPELLQAKANRSRIEYYFTLTPFLPRFLFAQISDLKQITYLDSDLCFFGDPELAFKTIGTAPIAISPHNFSPGFAADIKFGRFNVGWLTFARGAAATECLQQWSDQCADWCYDRVEPTRFADQKYLDTWPQSFSDLKILDHPGINAGPWNFDNGDYARTSAGPTLGGAPLVCFHFQGIRQGPNGQFNLGLEGRQLDRHADPQAPIYHDLYGSYLTALVAARAAIKGLVPPDEIGANARTAPGGVSLAPQFELLPDGWPTTPLPGWDTDSHAAARLKNLAALRARWSKDGPFSGAPHDIFNAEMLGRVLDQAAGDRTHVSVLDWGGGVGETYWLSRLVRPNLSYSYKIKELPRVCVVGRRQEDAPTFVADEDELVGRKFDLVLASGVLHYHQDWRSTMIRLANATNRIMLLTRTPFTSQAIPMAYLQRSPDYGTSYPGWILPQQAVADLAAVAGLRLQEQFDCRESYPIAGLAQRVQLGGLIFTPAQFAS